MNHFIHFVGWCTACDDCALDIRVLLDVSMPRCASTWCVVQNYDLAIAKLSELRNDTRFNEFMK